MNDKNDLLKIIAIISMTIDHVGWLFWPDIIIFRAIGRITFPIFAHQIALGYQMTKNVYKYMFRLLIFGIISQIPYLLLTDGLNIFFTLLIGLIMIHLKEKTNTILGLFLLIPCYFLKIEYGIYGLLMIYGFYLFKDNKLLTAVSTVSLTIIFSLFYYNNLVQVLAVLALPLIFHKSKMKISLNKYFFYLYYPIHLLILEYILFNM